MKKKIDEKIGSLNNHSHSQANKIKKKKKSKVAVWSWTRTSYACTWVLDDKTMDEGNERRKMVSEW